MDQSIIAKGIADKISIQLIEEEWGQARDSLYAYIEQNANFLTGAKIILQTGRLSLRSNDLFDLRNKLEDYSVTIYSIDSNDEDTRRSARLLGIKLHTAEITKPSKESKTPPLTKDGESLFLEKTIRSGQTIDHSGHIILLGDVNPGGCLRAGGNILVWGKIKGEVHAGTKGDLGSIITAFELSPSMLTIGGIQCQTSIKRHGKTPEYAHIAGNTVKIDNWKI
jgi:septum site-determining protein MinC